MRTTELLVTIAAWCAGCGSKNDAPVPAPVEPARDAQPLAVQPPDAGPPPAPPARQLKPARVVAVQTWMGTTFKNGLVIATVRPDSPAAKADIRVDDEIIEAEGKPMKLRIDLAKLMHAKEIGDTFALRIKRGKRTLTTKVELAVSHAILERLHKSVGQPAPDFSGLETDSKTPIADTKGKVVVLAFLANDCALCTAVVPELSKLLAKYESKGLAVIAITSEAEPKQPTNDVVIAHDPGPIVRLFGVVAAPTLVVIDRTGTIRDAIVPTRKQLPTLGKTLEPVFATTPQAPAKPHGDATGSASRSPTSP